MLEYLPVEMFKFDKYYFFLKSNCNINADKFIWFDTYYVYRIKFITL